MRAGAVREAVDVLAQSGYATGGDIDLLGERVRVGLAHPGVAPARLFFGGAEADDEAEPGEEAEARLPTLVEDIAAIEARARKEMAFATDDSGSRQKYAAISARLYETIFAATGGTYAGINAAMMSSVAGEAKRSAALARKIVAVLGKAPAGLLGERHPRRGPSAARRGEGRARRIRRGGARTGCLRRQALLHAPAASPHRRPCRPVPSNASSTGCRSAASRSIPAARSSDLDADAQEDLEEALRPRIAAALAAEGIRYVYGSLASGADILFAEAALAAGCDLHVVLPFPVESFVEDGGRRRQSARGADRWGERFRACLNHSTSLISAVDFPPPGVRSTPTSIAAFASPPASPCCTPTR